MKIVTQIIVAAFLLVPGVAVADPYHLPYSRPYSSPLYTRPTLSDYTYKSYGKGYRPGGYGRYIYKYRDSLGNRHKSKTRVLPGGTTVTKGKYRGSYRDRLWPDHTYKSQSKSYRVGGYQRHTYKYKDSLGNRHKGTIERFPGGAVRHKGKVNGGRFKETYRIR